eukprot:SAG11_NODE_22660_length_402_cov_1.108911_1_plen_74_part_10
MYRGIRFSWITDARNDIATARGRDTTCTKMYEGQMHTSIGSCIALDPGKTRESRALVRVFDLEQKSEPEGLGQM